MINLDSVEKKSHKKLKVLIICGAVLLIAAAVVFIVINAFAVSFDVEVKGDVCTVTINGMGKVERSDVEDIIAIEEVRAAKEIRIILSDGISAISNQAFASLLVNNYDAYNEARTILNNVTEIEIPESVSEIGQYAFHGLVGTTIYCEASSKPSEWDVIWTGDPSNHSAVVWNCKNNNVAEDGHVYTVVDGIRYGIKNGQACVARQKSTIVTGTVKKEITYNRKTYPVTSICDFAFYDCRDLNGINISTTVESIGAYAFAKSGIKGVFTPSVKTIGEYAFENCDNLTEVILATGLVEVGDYAFSYCRNLTSITLPTTLTSISDYMFYYCDGLKDVFFLENITSIGERAFQSCTSLESILLYSTMKTVGAYAFSGCTNLKILCAFDSQPSAWDINWNSSNCPVVWNNRTTK